jgi:hypothetical protein
MAIMGNVNSLIIEEKFSFSVKTRVVTVKTIGSLAIPIIDIRKMYRSRKEMLITLLEQQRAEKEAEVVTAVEHCLHLIRERLNNFFKENKKSINLYAIQIMNRKKKIDNKGLFQQVINEKELAHLQIEIKKEIQQEIQLLFAVKSLTLAGSNPSFDALIDHQNINTLLSEYRKTIFVAKHITTAANTIWDQCLDTLNVPNIIGKVIKKFALGSIFVSTVNCQAKDQSISCQREIEKYLTGVMMNIEHQIYQEMSGTVVKVFYELYDQIIASYFDKHVALVEAKDNKNSGKEKISLYLLKQAYMSL